MVFGREQLGVYCAAIEYAVGEIPRDRLSNVRPFKKSKSISTAMPIPTGVHEASPQASIVRALITLIFG